MKFTYDGQEYELVDPWTWTTIEAIKLEQYTGLRMEPLMREFAGLQPLGVHATIWVSLRRAGVDVAWDELVLPHIDTVASMKGEPVEEAPDPSAASIGQRKAASPAQSGKPRRSPKK